MQRLAVILLAIYLIVLGLFDLLGFQLFGLDILIPLLALAAGVLLLIGSTSMKLSGRYAVLLLAIYLVLVGALSLFSINFPASQIVLGLLALAAGILLIIRR